MKLDNALTQKRKKKGKLYFWEIFEDAFPNFLPRAFLTETRSLAYRILCKCNNKIPNWNCFILSLFIVPNLGTPFRSKRIETLKEKKKTN